MRAFIPAERPHCRERNGPTQFMVHRSQMKQKNTRSSVDLAKDSFGTFSMTHLNLSDCFMRNAEADMRQHQCQSLLHLLNFPSKAFSALSFRPFLCCFLLLFYPTTNFTPTLSSHEHLFRLYSVFSPLYPSIFLVFFL